MSVDISNLPLVQMAIDDVGDDIDELTKFFMDSSDSIGDALKACCEAETASVSIPYHMYVPGTPGDPDATPPVAPVAPTFAISNQSVPSNQAGAISAGLTACSALAYQSEQQTNAYEYAAGLQNKQWESWFEDYQNWRTLQIIPQLVALAASIDQFQEYNDEYKKYLTCSNEVMVNMKDMIQCLSDEYGEAKGDYKAKMDALGAQQDQIFGDVASKYATYCDGTLQQEARDLFLEDGGGPGELGAGWATLTRSHAQNIATHLGQVCTDGRDASLALKDKWENFEAEAGVKYNELECQLIDLGIEDSMASQLVEMLTKAKEICDQLQECGTTLQDNYMNNVQPDYTETLQDWINCIKGDGDGTVLGRIKNNIGCIEDNLQLRKEEYLASYQQLHQPGCNSDLAIKSLKQMFEGGGITSVRDCIDYFQNLAESRDDIIDRYLGEQGPNGESGEFCLGRVIIDQACGLVNNADGAIQMLDTLGTDCYQMYLDMYKDGENCFAPALFDTACQLSTCLVALNDWFKNNAEDMLACYEEGYGQEKEAMACLIADAATLCDKHSEDYAWLCDCAVDLKEALWFNCYRPGEETLAKDALAQAAEYLVNQDTDYAYSRDLADLMRQCYEGDYQLPQKVLDSELFAKATELVQCICDSHEFLCDKADKQYAHWCEFWKAKEEEYVCQIFDCAILLAKESYECLESMCEVSDAHLEYFNECYKDAECITSPKLIEAAERACAKNEETYAELCDHEEDMYKKWADEFCQCDITDLQDVCGIMDKISPICEVEADAQCAQDLAERLKDCYYELVLPCEKRYIDEICKLQPYEAQYCDVEDRALLAISAAFTRRKDEIRCNTTKFNKGLIEQQLQECAREEARSIAAHMESANRHEKWWEAQEFNRRHNHTMDIIRFGERYPTMALQAYQQSTAAHDIILARLHQRIERGYVYLQNSQGYGDKVLGAVARSVEAGIATIREGHFWPEQYTRVRDTYLTHTENRMRIADDVMGIGLQHMGQAESAKNSAANIALGAIDRGQQATQNGFSLLNCGKQFQQDTINVHSNAIQNGFNAVDRGHSVLREAIGAKVQADQVVSRSNQELLGAVDRGHFWQDRAITNKQQSSELISRTMDDGLFLTDKGHRLKQQAIEAEVQQASQATAFVGRGIQAIQEGHFWVQQQSADKQNAAAEFHQGMSETMQWVDRSMGHMQQALNEATRADAALRGVGDLGLAAGRQALDEFNQANRKLETAMETGMAGAQQLLEMHRIGVGKDRDMCEVMIRHMQMIPPVANSFTNMANEGHRLLGLSMEHERQQAKCSLDRLQSYCQMQAAYNSYLTNSISSASTSVFGQAFKAAQHFQYMSDSALNDFTGVLTGIFATPPAPFGGVYGFGGQGGVGISGAAGGDSGGGSTT